MRRLSLLIAACGIGMACSGEPPSAPPPPPPLLPTFVVFGTVHDDAGAPVSGAIVDDLTGGRSAISNDSGYFSFTGVRGPMKLLVRKDGYVIQVHDLGVVFADRAINIELLKLTVTASDSIVLGATITSTVPGDAAPCDPIGWDAQAPCRRLGFTAPYSGFLNISIARESGSPLDVIILGPSNEFLAYVDELTSGAITLGTQVVAGSTYEIRISSYYGGAVFSLRADLTP